MHLSPVSKSECVCIRLAHVTASTDCFFWQHMTVGELQLSLEIRVFLPSLLRRKIWKVNPKSHQEKTFRSQVRNKTYFGLHVS